MYWTDRTAQPAPPLAAGERAPVVEIITTIDGMTALRAEWLALEAKTADGFTYFQSYDWCLCWARAYLPASDARTDCGLRIVCIRRGGILLGLWPLVVRRRPFGGRIAKFIGEPHAQYGNALIDWTRLTLAEAGECWREARMKLGADAIVLDRLPERSAAARVLGGMDLFRDAAGAASVMDLGRLGSWQDYQAGIGRPARKSRNRRRRRLEAEGKLEFRLLSGGTAAFGEMVKRALEMKTDWLRATGRPDNAITDRRTALLLSALTGNAEEPSGAVASTLLLDGKPISIEIGFCRNGHYYSFLGAFDWSYRDFSPGKVHIEASLKWAMETGLAKFDLLGVPAAYKEHWSNTSVGLVGHCEAMSLAGAFYARLWWPSLRPYAKRTFDCLPIAFKRQIAAALF